MRFGRLNKTSYINITLGLSHNDLKATPPQIIRKLLLVCE